MQMYRRRQDRQASATSRDAAEVADRADEQHNPGRPGMCKGMRVGVLVCV
jgi:hypothetical protein